MKKLLEILIIIGGIFTLCGCQKNIKEVFLPYKGEEGGVTNNSSDLKFLSNGATTNDGYYYLTDYSRLNNDKLAKHLMYIDFKTKQEIHLCNNSACTHKTEDCTSVFNKDEFQYDSKVFIWNNKIYVISKSTDTSGQVTMGVLGETSKSNVESNKVVLYKLNLDGTNREKIYTFDDNATIEDFVIGSGNGIYLIAKKVETKYTGVNAYSTSSERKLIYLDLNTKKESTILSMNRNDNIDWKVIGSTKRNLILHGIDLGGQVTDEEKHNNNELYKNSSDVFALLDIDNDTLKEVYRVKAPSRTYTVDEKNLYYNIDGNSKILKIDLKTGKEETLANLSSVWVDRVIDNKLLCITNSGKNPTSYFIDVDTGKMTESKLVNKSTGFYIEIISTSQKEVLAIYNSDVTFNSDGSWTTHSNKYGVISKEDFYSGKDNFKGIKRVYGGE
jgi:hypothetical protein